MAVRDEKWRLGTEDGFNANILYNTGPDAPREQQIATVTDLYINAEVKEVTEHARTRPRVKAGLERARVIEKAPDFGRTLHRIYYVLWQCDPSPRVSAMREEIKATLAGTVFEVE